MPTLRQSAVITATIRSSAAFAFDDDDDELSQVRGGLEVSDTITWDQGDPLIQNLDAAADFTLKFYADSAGATEIDTNHADYDIGDQGLGDIFTLGSFVDNGDDTGSIDIMMDPSGITMAELSASRTVYMQIEINQPDPGDN